MPESTFTQPPLKSTVRSNISLTIDGTISVQVDVFAAVEDDSVGLNQLCTNEHAPVRVKQSLACPICGSTRGHVKGKAKDDGFVIVPADILDKAKQAAAKVHDQIDLAVHRSVDVVAAMPTGKTYYLKVAKGSSAAPRYAALAQALEQRSDLTLVGTLSLKGAPARFALVSSGRTLMLRQLADPAMVRQRPVIDGPVDEVMASKVSAILDMLITDFDPLLRSNLSDKVVQEYIDVTPAVTAGTAPLPEPSIPADAVVGGGESLDEMLAMLRARSGQSLVAVPEQAPAPRKRAARKPAAKKTTQKVS